MKRILFSSVILFRIYLYVYTYAYFIYFRLKAKIIDGKGIANTILNELRIETEEWVSKGHRAPRLVAVLVGQDPASKIYVSNKMKAAKVVGKYSYDSKVKVHLIILFKNIHFD